MVEVEMSGGGGGDKSPLQLQSSSFDSSLLPAPSYHPYPPPVTTYEEIVRSRELFLETLKKLHVAMGTKFMVPVIGGKNLDLYKLFLEVSSRGGINTAMKEKKWKEVIATFSFSSSVTNSSFIVRKHYVSLLYHYEQIYLFKAKFWTPLSSTDALQNVQTYAASPQRKSINTAAVPEVSSAAVAAGSPVCGVIDGKFESGYLITVKIGSEDFKGVLYQVSPTNESHIISANHQTQIQTQRGPTTDIMSYAPAKLGLPRRKRRKKCEIRKRDPAHPKPNRSGYNFFFAEQHARLKPHYHGRDREISRMIGELWNKLQEPERAVYQEKALRDKERYKIEMEDYRERLKMGQMTRNPVSLQQSPPALELNSTNFDVNLEFEGTTSAYIEENESSSDKSMEEDGSADKDLEIGEYSQAEAALKNVNIQVLSDEAFQLQTGLDKVGYDYRNQGRGVTDDKNALSPGNAEVGILVPIEEGIFKSSNADEQVYSH